MQIKPQYQIGKCPHCSARQRGNVADVYLYGSPVRTCRKCGQQFWDKCYHEVEIDGFQTADTSLEENRKNIRNALLLIASAVALNVLFYVLDRHSWIYILFVAFGFVYLAVAVKDYCKVKKGTRGLELEALRRESAERLSDPAYALELRELGYEVPEKYLPE